jgi:hypothetical protein
MDKLKAHLDKQIGIDMEHAFPQAES